MNLSWSIEELCRAWGCRPIQAAEASPITGFSIDSRTLKAGELFLCLRGERKDGHDYISQALSAGAKALLVEESYLQTRPSFPSNVSVFSKAKGLEALQELASFHRQRLKAVIIGVTGSNGKTSTKEILASLLASLIGKESLSATSGNLNNHVGLPLSLLRARPEDAYVILEMGMNHPGEIRFLSRLAKPHHAIITSVSNAHREFFESISSIAKAKLEILEGMPASSQSHLMYHALSPGLELAQEAAQRKGIQLRFFGFPSSGDIMEDTKEGLRKDTEELRMGCRLKTGIVLESSGYGRRLRADYAEGIRFLWEGQEAHCKNLFHPVLASNLLSCLALLSHLGFREKDLREAMQELHLQSRQRFEAISKERPGKAPQLLIDDSYNANPESFVLAIDALRQLLPKGSLALCMGEMGELGEEAEEAHRTVAARAARAGYHLLALVKGNFSESIRETYLEHHSKGRFIEAESSLSLAEELCNSLDLSEFDGILVKASRFVRMELLCEILKNNKYV